MGSVHYISPEQAKGERIDERSDIYSAGVVLYEMLTSRLPFEGDTPVSIAIQHFSAVPLNPREINPDIPEALELICMKAMAPQLDRRYRTADEMIRDLEDFRKNPEINFDYDLLDLRGEAPIDEPTMMLKSKDLQELSTRDNHRGGYERTGAGACCHGRRLCWRFWLRRCAYWSLSGFTGLFSAVSAAETLENMWCRTSWA